MEWPPLGHFVDSARFIARRSHTSNGALGARRLPRSNATRVVVAIICRTLLPIGGAATAQSQAAGQLRTGIFATAATLRTGVIYGQ